MALPSVSFTMAHSLKETTTTADSAANVSKLTKTATCTSAITKTESRKVMDRIIRSAPSKPTKVIFHYITGNW
jgi:hypothetical protein